MGIFKGLSKRIVKIIQKRIDDAENKIIHNKNINSNKLYQGIISSGKNGIKIFDLLGNFFGYFTNDFNKLDIKHIGDDEEYQFNLTGHLLPLESIEKFKCNNYYYLVYDNDNTLICMKIKDMYYDTITGIIMKCEILVPFNGGINIYNN